MGLKKKGNPQEEWTTGWSLFRLNLRVARQLGSGMFMCKPRTAQPQGRFQRYGTESRIASGTEHQKGEKGGTASGPEEE